MVDAARMYLKGASTHDVEDVLKEMGIEGMSATRVSNATKRLDEELEEWRTCGFAETKYLTLDARYEKVRIDGVARDAVILTAIGVVPDEDDPSISRRRGLEVSVVLSEAKVYWREFLDSLVACGIRRVEFVVSDDHAGLVPPVRSRFPARRGSAASAASSATPSAAPIRKQSRHSESLCAGTPMSRETASRLSLRMSRWTAAVLRRAVGACRRSRSRRTQSLLVRLIHGVSSRLLRSAYRDKK